MSSRCLIISEVEFNKISSKRMIRRFLEAMSQMKRLNISLKCQRMIQNTMYQTPIWMREWRMLRWTSVFWSYALVDGPCLSWKAKINLFEISELQNVDKVCPTIIFSRALWRFSWRSVTCIVAMYTKCSVAYAWRCTMRHIRQSCIVTENKTVLWQCLVTVHMIVIL